MARKPAIPLITDFNNIPEEALVPEAEQPFAIPDHWKWVRLGSICTVSKEKTSDFSKYDKYLGLEHLLTKGGIKSVGNTDNILSQKTVFKSGDLLYGKLRPYLEKYVIAPFDGVCSTDILVFSICDSYNIEFLKTCISHTYFTNLSVKLSKGINLPRISEKTILAFPVPIAPLKEQETSISALEQRLVDIDRSTEVAEAILSDYEKQVEALISAGVSGVLTADWRQEHERSRDKWTQTTLGKAFKWSSGGTPSRKHAEYYNGTIPWVKSGELPNGVITETSEHITEEAIKNSSAKVFPAGSVLIAMYGATIGQVGILSMDAATNQAIAAAQASPHTLNEYLFYFLQASKDEFIALGKGGAQPNISQTVIKSFPYTIPPLDEQKLIIERLKTNLQNYQEAMFKIEEALKLLEHTKENLVMATLSGKLV